MSAYRRGSKWRVVKPGARIVGMKSSGSFSFTGFALDLPVGTVLTCEGSSMTFGDGYPVLKWRDENNRPICMDAEIQGNPADYLEPI